MFLCLWYFCFQKKSKGLSVSLPYLSWNIETSAVVDILFLIVFMQLKLKIEQLVCHWRAKMLQAQSVFTGERLTLLNSPLHILFRHHGLPNILNMFWRQPFEIWILNILIVSGYKLKVFLKAHTFELLPPSLASRHDVPPSISYPVFWTCSGGSHLRFVHDNVIAFEICADARLSRICSAWFTGQLSSSAEPPSTTFLHINARLIGNNAACVCVFYL